MKIARHRGIEKAIVALARRLAVIMHRVWVDGTAFRWTREIAPAIETIRGASRIESIIDYACLLAGKGTLARTTGELITRTLHGRMT
jgi:hypothetical protein